MRRAEEVVGRETRELLAARAALGALGGPVVLLATPPRLITSRSSARACLAALGLSPEAEAADILAAVTARDKDAASRLDRLRRRGAPCDIEISTPTGRIRAAGRSAGALAWLRLSLAAEPRRTRIKPPPITFDAALSEALSDAIAGFDSDRRLVWCNAAFAELWELEPAWVGRRPTHGEWLDRLRRRGRLPETADYARFRADELGRHQLAGPAEPTIWRLPDERLLKVASLPREPGGMALVFSDITREAALTGRINQLAQVQRAILDTLTDAVAVFTGNARLMLHNPAFERFFDLGARAIAEQPDFDGIAALCVAKLHDLGFWRDLKGRITDADPGVRVAAAGELRLGDGRWAAWRSQPLPDGATLISFADVTHERSLAEALAGREAALADAERMRRSFVASVSYEMRIPLTTVLGYCDLIERAGRLADARDRTWLAAARTAAGQLAASVEDVLTLAELDAGELILEFEAVNLGELLASVAKARAAAAAQTAVALRIDPPISPAEIPAIIWADSRRLHQALDHLVANALRHTPAGGVIRLGAELGEGEARISVRDNGRGIPFDVQAHAFDRFGAHGPAGVGLALVKALVELHGGWVALESEPGAGAAFTCHLPEAGAPDDRSDLFEIGAPAPPA